MSTVLFLSLRALHVLLAAVWVGATVFITFLLMPAIDGSGPAGGQVMMGLDRKGMSPFFGAIGGITVLTGVYLFWHFTGGFDPGISGSHAGIAFSIGGLAGFIAVILGGAVVGRSSKQVVEVMKQAGPMPEGPQKRALLETAEALKQKMRTFGMVVLFCQVIALLLMSVAHYI